MKNYLKILCIFLYRKIINFIFKERKIPLLLYFMSLKGLLITFPLLNLLFTHEISKYTLTLNLIFFITAYAALRSQLKAWNMLKGNFIYIMYFSFAFSL